MIGRRCLQDSECAAGMTCITQDATGPLLGGIQGGLCTAQCASDLDCERIDRNSLCAPYDDAGTPRDTSDDTGVCVETCLPGSSDVKCHDRVEMSCYPIAVDLGLCLPTCTSDYNCEPRVCDLSSGFCIDAADRPAGGLPIGSACDPTNDQCAGYCVDTQDGSGLCTSDCNLAGLISASGCGTDPRSPEVDALCYYAGADDALGDVGLCAELCDCDDDCARSDMVCDAMPTMLQQITGHVGACFVSNPDIDGGTMGIPCGPSSGDAGPTTPPEAGTPTPSQDAAPDAP